MKPAVLLSTFLVAGCSSISWFGQSAGPSQGLQPIAKSDEAALAALDSCKTQADAVIRRDTRIDRDISGGPTFGSRNEDNADLLRNMNAFGTKQRYERIVESCLRQRGYAMPVDERVR